MRCSTHTLIAATVAAVTVGAHTLYLTFPAGRIAEEVFYVSRGVEGAVIFFALAYFAFRPTVRRLPTGLLFVACAFGAYEESLTVVCGLPAIGERMASKPVVAAMDGLCGAITGIPWALAEACLILLFVLLFMVVKSGQQQRRASDGAAR
jgi:hypothetical protein